MERRKFIANLAGIGALSVLAPGSVFSKNIAATKNWHIEQFKDKGLAHFSYAILVDRKVIIVDPERDPQQYYDFAKTHDAKISGIIETHPHADFASSHLEIHQEWKAAIYASSLTRPSYPFTAFDDGAILKLSDQVSLRSLFTPGHAPDHISVVLQENGKDIAVFSGDALLIGDVGRPDLRDYTNDVQTQRTRLAALMYHTIHQKFAKLADDVVVYPAHGAGSLCGKAIRDASSSTIGEEKLHNYAFESRTEVDFIRILLDELPFVPKYFPYDVQLNIKGSPNLTASIAKVKILQKDFQPDQQAIIIDGRPSASFKKSYLKNAINVQDATRFETWLGSVVAPDTPFYLVADDQNNLSRLIYKTAKIGYESNIKGAFVYDELDGNQFTAFDNNSFDPNSDQYTIIDVRSEKEVKENKIFKKAINIPLQELSSRISEIPTTKPILVHCASGYRSAAGSSLIKKYLPDLEIFDLGPAVTQYEGESKTREKGNTNHQ